MIMTGIVIYNYPARSSDNCFLIAILANITAGMFFLSYEFGKEKKSTVDFVLGIVWLIISFIHLLMYSQLGRS